MPTTSKYFVTSTVTGQNWVDFDLGIDQLTIAGQDFIFTGSNYVDSVRVGPGVIFDFTKSNGGKDNLFLSGRLSDYTLTPATSTLTLERGSGASYEKIIVAKGTSTNFDNVIFTDGTASTFDLHGKASGTLIDLMMSAPLSPPETLNATVKAFALDATGEVFAPSSRGVNYILTGSNAVDMVYVNPGATIDATKLNGGVDEIYFTGHWSDYTKEVFTSKIVFSNPVTGDNVTVSVGSGASNDRLVFADGSVQTVNAKTALTGSLSASISSVIGLDVTKTTPGLAPKITSSVDDVTNLDVTSPIVLKVSQGVIPVAGKFIRLMNDGGVGFRGEAADNDQIIEVTSSSVTVSGNLIIIRPPFDLDLANNYHLEIDAGAFVNAQSKGNAAVSDAGVLNFSTVIPGLGLTGVASAVQSQSMSTTTGAMQASFSWLDIEGVGSPSATVATGVDMASGDIALVFKDYDNAPGDVGLATDGVGAPDFYVRASGFAAGDLIYADNQSPSQTNLLTQTQVLAETPSAGLTTVSFGSGTSGLGGVVEVALAGSSGTFTTIEQLRAALGVAYAPIAESAGLAGSASVAIQGLSASDVVAEGGSITYTVALDAAAPAAGFVVDWRVNPGTVGDPAEAQDFGAGTSTAFPTGSLTIEAGQTTGKIVVQVFDDAQEEFAETFVLQVGRLTAGTFTSVKEWSASITASDTPASDTTPPALASAAVSTDGRTITLTFSEGLDIAAASSSQLLERFSVSAGLVSQWPLSFAQVQNSTVVLTTPDYAPIPRPASLNPSTVTVSYTDLTLSNDATGVLQDYPAGNDVASFSGFTAQNNSTYTPGAPTLPNVQTVNGAFAVSEGQGLTYAVTLDAPAPSGGMTLAWKVTPATAGASAAPEDFLNTSAGQLPSGELYFGSGATQAFVTLQIKDDTTDEPAEGYFFKVGKFDAAQIFQPIAGAEVYTIIYESDAGGVGIQPGNSGLTYFTTPATGTSDLVIGFSEKIAFSYPEATSVSGISLAVNPDPSDPYRSTGVTSPQITGFILSEDGRVLTLKTNTQFTADDVVLVRIGSYTNLVDVDGNMLAAQDIYIGGDGPNTIDLEYFGSMSRQILRGNGGADELIGTYNADTLIDGGGADVLDGLRGGDSFFLVENGSTGSNPLASTSDTVIIGLDDSRRGFGNTDAIFGDPANANSGFDWFSSDASKHDVLALESGVIGSTTSFVGTPAAQGAITSHGITAGIVTFRNSAGAEVVITQATNLGNALDYLRYNLQAPGHTVAFKADDDNNGVAESLFVYQDMGTLPLLGDAEMPDIVVRIEQPATNAASRLQAVTLGNAPGANVLEIGDGFAPEPLGIGLASNGVVMNFAEPVYAPSSVGNLAMTLQVNGTGVEYKPAVVMGSGTAALLVQCADLVVGTASLKPSDWALISYGGADISNALRDAAGNLLRAEDDNGNPVTHTFALGSSGANVIDLSARTVSGWGLDIEAGGGDDSITGTAAPDWIWAGSGADTMTGGAGGDNFDFQQGDSPLVTIDLSGVAANSFGLTGATYTFATGKAEVITDFGAGDEVYLNPYLDGLTGARWLSSSSYSSIGGPDGSGLTGLPGDQSFKALQGDLSANGVFTVGVDYSSGQDLLVLYDGDGSDSVSPTAFVLQGVTMNDIQGLYNGGNVIRSSKPVDNGGGGGTIGGTYIDWSQDQNSLFRIAGDDELEFTVHFSDPVRIDTSKGQPQLKVTFVDDSGASHDAYAAFMPYGQPDLSGAYVQNSMRFALGLLPTDVGRYHVEALVSNGAGIVGLSDNLAADLTLDDTNRPFTASGYVYPAPLASMTGTAGNDVIGGYLANPAAVPADGNYAGVTGGDGNRDVLAVPILLPGALTVEQANGYVLNFDRTNMVMQAFAAGSTTAAVTLKVPSTFPPGVERLAYFMMFQPAGTGGTAAYEFADGSPVILSSAVITYQDPVDEGDAFVFGSLNADTITLPEIAGGRQAVRAGPGGDSIIGSSGVDMINGDGGNDTIRAGGGDDFIFLSGGTDSVDGGGGQDTVVATLPGQMMTIGGRISGFALQSLTGQWTTTGFEATSTSNVYRILADDSGALTVRNFSDGTTAMWASNVEAIEVRQAQSDIRTTVPLILGSADALPDLLVGAGSSIVNGRAGDDTLTASSLGNDVLLGGSGNDTLNGGTARDLLYGGPGDDALNGGGSNDWFVGEGGNDTLEGGNGNDAAGFLVANASATPLSFAWDSTADGVLIKQGTLVLAKISAGANGVWLVQDLANPSTGFGTDTVSGVENLTFDFGSGSTATTALTITSVQIDELLFASPWSGVVTGLAAAGYTAAIPATGLTPDPGILGVTALAPQVNNVAGTTTTTTLRYDITLDPTTLSDVDPMLVLIQFGGGLSGVLSGVLSASAISPTWVDSGGQARPMWLLDTSALASSGQVWATANGVSDPALYQANPLIEPGTGRVATVELTVSGSVSSAPVLSVAGVELYTADWLDAMLAAQPPLLVAQVSEASQVQISGLPDDNLLRYAAIYDQTTGETHVSAMFDTNPALNQVEPSALIDLSFLGDVRASLVPESLTFSG